MGSSSGCDMYKYESSDVAITVCEALGCTEAITNPVYLVSYANW